MVEVVVVALGSNLGDRAQHLAAARAALAGLPGTRVLQVSTMEETAPLGGLDQPAYLNQVAQVETELEPRSLLEACQAIERAEGRTRGARWASRSLDIDIIQFGRRHVDEPGLTIPHPELPNRDFWQRGLAEVQTP
ncbi:MAG: 2-amino-4-hydroxy-6-hydroxymethyldihydropteridine diphosphokinase [Gemmatimonadales bacterium]|nr:MAG: 2-amino-4-hydroxy-6-hydroxymethyldihydropteridine diphosphokinase [Gemmatimonadales bacterium]